MTINRPIFTLGFDKNGECDFGVSATVKSLTQKQYNEIRLMMIVGIGVMEDMKRRSLESALSTPETKTSEGGE